MNSLGQIVKQHRLSLNLSQTELARRTGGKVAQSKIAMLETGAQENLRLSTLRALAHALDCTLVDLLPEEDKHKRSA